MLFTFEKTRRKKIPSVDSPYSEFSSTSLLFRVVIKVYLSYRAFSLLATSHVFSNKLTLKGFIFFIQILRIIFFLSFFSGFSILSFNSFFIDFCVFRMIIFFFFFHLFVLCMNGLVYNKQSIDQKLFCLLSFETRLRRW